jgi:hypothetical protein
MDHNTGCGLITRIKSIIVLKSFARHIILISLLLVFTNCNDAVLQLFLTLSENLQSSLVGNDFNEALDSIDQIDLVGERNPFQFLLDAAKEKEVSRGQVRIIWRMLYF